MLCEGRAVADSDITVSQTFESNPIKIQNSNISDLAQADKRHEKRFSIVWPTKKDCWQCEICFFVRWLFNRQKLSLQPFKEDCLDVRFIVATSNICENMFSYAGFTMGDCQRELLPYLILNWRSFCMSAFCYEKNVMHVVGRSSGLSSHSVNPQNLYWIT